MEKIILIVFALFSICFYANGEEMSSKMNSCPDSPNCVVSLYPEDTKHYVEPIDDFPKSISKIRSILENLGLEVQSESEDELHATATSRFFKFVDDVHIKLVQGKIHFRSASRKGYYDFGVNRNRVEKIKTKINSLNN